jgi:hypothetical protein
MDLAKGIGPVMKRMILAMLLAGSAMLTSQEASAQGYPKHLGCGGFCFKFLGGLHMHGPLYNYGPYSGYYPFEPYGPWNSQLQYTGPMPGNPGCGWNGLCGGRGCGAAGGAVGGCGSTAGCSAGGCGLSLNGGFAFGLGGGGGCHQGLGLGLGHHVLGQHGIANATSHGLFQGFHRATSGACDSGCNPGFGSKAKAFFANIFERSHPLCRKAKISTGCSAAPACGSAAPVGCGTPVTSACGGGCSASAVGVGQLETVLLTGVILTPESSQFRRER